MKGLLGTPGSYSCSLQQGRFTQPFSRAFHRKLHRKWPSKIADSRASMRLDPTFIRAPRGQHAFTSLLFDVAFVPCGRNILACSVANSGSMILVPVCSALLFNDWNVLVVAKCPDAGTMKHKSPTTGINFARDDHGLPSDRHPHRSVSIDCIPDQFKTTKEDFVQEILLLLSSSPSELPVSPSSSEPPHPTSENNIMPGLESISWVVVDKDGEHDPVQTFRLLRQQELARPNPNLAAQLCDLSYDSICALLAVDPGTATAELYGALLPSETMMRLQESSWETIKASIVRDFAKTKGGCAVIKIGLMERLEETACGTIVIGY